MIKLIGISGKICSGKTTLSNALIKEYGYTRMVIAQPIKEIGQCYIKYHKSSIKSDRLALFQSVKFVEELKKILFDLFCTDKSQMYSAVLSKVERAQDMLFYDVFPRFQTIDSSVEKNDDIRNLYQTIGNVFRDAFGDDIWVKAMIKRIKDDKESKGFVCDDVRQKSEYTTMKDFGFKIIRLEISSEEQLKRCNRAYGDVNPARFTHISEIDLDDVNDFDLIIKNGTSLEDSFDMSKKYIETRRGVL